MEVTRNNFSDLLPELTSVINNASFLCIDGEFTGLNTGNGVTAYDTPSQYYCKLRDGAMGFLLCQFGLAAFRFDEKKQKYTHTAYNFYLFPRPHNRDARDIRFMCQSSSVDFLASQGFDFNKVFKEGIPFLSDPDEKDIRDQLEKKRKSLSTPQDNIKIPDDLKSCVENACQQIQQFLDSDKNEQEIVLERSNGFVRRLVYQEVRERFSPNDLAVETKNFIMIARKIKGNEERLKEEQEKRKQEEAEIDDAVGFTHVIRLISKSGKLVVGHNLLIDLLHTIRQFYMPLPDSYEEFKELLHTIFPLILDTKYMCSAPPFKDILTTTALVNLLNALKEKPFSMPDVDCEEGKGYKSVELKYHEAGFDAYMTGLVFLSLGNFLKKTRVLPSKGNDSIVNSPYLKPYINRLVLMRIADTHLNVSGPDTVPSRDHVFHLTFPKDWRHNEINQLFSPYGSVYVGWINDRSAWISLQDREQTVHVKKNLLNNVSNMDVTLTHYSDYMKQLDSKNGSTGINHSTPSGNMFYSSPATSAARKRKSMGNQNIETNEAASKRSKRESIERRRSSKSGISVDTIPEEEEEISPSPKSHLKQEVRSNTSEDESCKVLPLANKRNLQFEENDQWD